MDNISGGDLRAQRQVQYTQLDMHATGYTRAARPTRRKLSNNVITFDESENGSASRCEDRKLFLSPSRVLCTHAFGTSVGHSKRRLDSGASLHSHPGAIEYSPSSRERNGGGYMYVRKAARRATRAPFAPNTYVRSLCHRSLSYPRRGNMQNINHSARFSVPKQ